MIGRAVAERGAAFPSFARAQSILNLGIFFSTEGNIQINLRSMVRSEGVPYVQLDAPQYTYYLDEQVRAAMQRDGVDPDATLAEAIAGDRACVEGLAQSGN